MPPRRHKAPPSLTLPLPFVSASPSLPTGTLLKNAIRPPLVGDFEGGGATAPQGLGRLALQSAHPPVSPPLAGDDRLISLPLGGSSKPSTASPPSHLELGVDEAGRGPILGPMVLACVALSPQAAQALSALGVADSKRFGAGPAAHRARQKLAEHIQKHAAHVGIAVIDPREIDARSGQLNHLEREHAARLIAAAPACARIFADGARLFAPLAERFPQLSAEDRAESAHICVAAASIIAKSRRDALWLGIAERYHPEFAAYLDGHAGGGYPNEATRRFLRAYYSRYRRLPPEARKTWPTDFLADL